MWGTVLAFTDFNQCFQDFVAIEKDINLFSNSFPVDVDGVKEDFRLIEMKCDDSLKWPPAISQCQEFFKVFGKVQISPDKAPCLKGARFIWLYVPM